MATSVRPILPDVYAEVRDGGLGIASGNLEGIQVKVGVASAGNIGEIVYLSSQRDAIQKFGSGPLVDACVDSFSSGAQIIYAVRANASVDGSIGGSYQLWIECTRPGECGVAQVHYSFDGGVKFGPKVTVPEDGKITISDRALTIQVPKTQTFEVPAEDDDGDPRQEQRTVSLNGGDVWKFNVDTQTGTAVKFSANTVDITVTGKPIAVTKNGAGTGALTVGGKPLIDADVIVEITASGGQNEATYRYSLDGGDNYSGNITVPEEETEIVGTGIMLTFSASGFEAGDTWVFSANAPQMSNDGIRVTTMAAQTSMNNSILDLYDLVSQERLKTDALASAPTTSRGVFVDPFLDDDMRDAGIEQTAAIVDGVLMLPIGADITDFENFTNSTLDYTDEIILSQTARTASMKINAYQAKAAPPANVGVSPSVDRWEEYRTNWASATTRTIVNRLTNDQARARGYANVGRVSRTVDTGSYSSVQSVSTRRTATTYMRQRNITVSANGFNANESVTLSFAGRNMGATGDGVITAKQSGLIKPAEATTATADIVRLAEIPTDILDTEE